MKSKRKKFTPILTFLILFLVVTTLVGTPISEAKSIRVKTRGIRARALLRSIAYLTQAIRRNPDDADAYKDPRKVCYEKGHYDLAIANFTKGIEIKPDYADTYMLCGLAYLKKGEITRAIADYSL